MRHLAYIGILALALLLGVTLGWTAFGEEINNYAYDFIFRIYQPPPWQTESIILAIDEETFSAYGGLLKLRQELADGLNHIRAAGPRAVAVDVILADNGDPAADTALEDAFRNAHGLVLTSDLVGDATHWEDPIPRFKRWAAALGHAHAELDGLDAISRAVPLERVAGHERRWALALEAFRVSRNAAIVESPDDLTVADVVIPSKRRLPGPGVAGRTLRVRYVPPSMGGIPRVSLKQLIDKPQLAARFRGKMVFAGVTAQNMDRWMTPYSASVSMPGIEMHANIFETIAHRLFLVDAGLGIVVLMCLLFAAAAGAVFALLEGWRANAAAVGILAAAHLLPYELFTRSIVFPFVPLAISTWLAILFAAAWRHFMVRRKLGQAEAARLKYREAMQFVSHEMKTPLTAIQGSSELISRYARMPEERRKQMADLINAESKRLTQMIESFLNAERLSEGQMQLRPEPCLAAEILARCVERVRPVADRKSIGIHLDALPDEPFVCDRELMEYAFYNLLSNAVKYSPPDTEITVAGDRERDRVRVWVRDQGIGIDPKDARRIFDKFYRTKVAEQSGEKGTGIGLSIVEQIVTQHGGAITVESQVGKGSTFTVSLPAAPKPTSLLRGHLLGVPPSADL